MIQELFGGSNVGIIGGDRSKLSTPSCGGSSILDHASPSPSPSVSHSPSSSSAATAAAATTTLENNLRCPRCDSANTKFCYYNNYNLTQPRHFCKTCRRYWTKGGALRNVPIGGGCRKNKNTTITAAVGKSVAATAKFKTVTSEMGKTGIFGGFEHAETLSSNPVIWASSQNSHFLSLIRGNQTQIPNHLTNSFNLKDETAPFGSNSGTSNGPRSFDPSHLGPTHLPSVGLYRNQTLNGHGILHGEGLQEVYHRLKTTSNYYPEHAPVILGNVTSANSSAILESAPVAAGELGFWNSNISWPTDLPTTNGAYP